MDLSKALTEPAVQLIEFHNEFNRNIKMSFGALRTLSDRLADAESGAYALPTGEEPWGAKTKWRDLKTPAIEAGNFLAEIGIVRATAAFEDYLTGAKAEFDRFGLSEVGPKAGGLATMDGLDAAFGVKPEAVEDIGRMADFFNVARNCVVHRSNRASKKLCELKADPKLTETLGRWPKRIAKWTVSLPEVARNEVVQWQPRHAIMASDVYYRSAMLLDRQLVRLLGDAAFVGMAAHWCLFADPPAPCAGKLDAGTMVRGQLIGRYKASSVSKAEVIGFLRQLERWDATKTAFDKLYPDGPQSSLAKMRRARRTGKLTGRFSR